MSPDELIPLAEESGLIAGIGDWVFKIAAEQLKQCQDFYAIDFQISINKSPAQFKSKIHHADWLRYLADLGLSGNNIVVEITEGLLMGAEPSIVETLRLFRDAGIHVAIYDFGTGYSSLSYLRK